MINMKQASNNSIILEFSDLSDEMKKTSHQKYPYLKPHDITKNYNVEKILLSEQRL